MSPAVLVVVVVALSSAATFAIIRLLLGPTLADRIISLDVLLVCLMAGIAIHAADTGETVWLNLLVVIAIIGFTATVATTRYIERSAETVRIGPTDPGPPSGDREEDATVDPPGHPATTEHEGVRR